MKRNQKCKIICFLIFTIIFLCSCEELSKNNQPVQHETKAIEQIMSTTISPCISGQEFISVDKYESAILTSINDDIWYRGRFSPFSGFVSETLEFELYKETSRKENTFFVIKKKAYDDSFPVYAICFAHYADTLNNEPSAYFKRYTIDQINEELIKTNSGYLPTGITGTLTFGEITEPVYPEMTEQKENLLNDFVNKLPYELKKLNYQVGKYNLYIKNFRKNDYRTFAVLEDALGESWVIKMDLDLDVEEDWDAYIGKIERITTYREDLKYAASQYRKMAIVATKIKVQ
ncbi:MAG: hypothetical protein PHG06_18340 [Parabacteroides sp.]|nr:hypothetical protein [Parabacteroides sp.]